MKRIPKPEELEERIEGYFGYCDSFNENDKCEIFKPYTLSGLLYHTGLTKEEFERLMTNKRYSRILCCAKSRIEAFIEENALTGELSCNASLNSLKYYFGWGEKKEDDKETAKAGHITLSLSPEICDLAR